MSLAADRMNAVLEAVADDIAAFSVRFRKERLDRQEWLLAVNLEKDASGQEVATIQLGPRRELLDVIKKARAAATNPDTRSNADDMIRTLGRSVPNGHMLLVVRVPEGLGAKYVPLVGKHLN